ncbi:chymotrypsin-like protease CTRL-1 [Labeo rohita]|uniref:Chymotrypsin-like protease CTRL-1 n=1 Tax=Labeo rohita TaxID=84645 RepID=A0A498M4G2_LABRO|nr:chymotrypsin-like protease CTRL-1 [Labeo rohita]
MYCGGSLISKDWVLSAAPCFEGFSASDVVMYFGRQSQWGLNPNEINRTARGIIIHQNYNDTLFNNDIALVQLSSSVTFSNYIRPVCLAAAGSKLAGGTESWITGWGTLQPGDQFAKILQEVMIPIVNNSDCNNAYGALITCNMICAGKGGKSSCQRRTGKIQEQKVTVSAGARRLRQRSKEGFLSRMQIFPMLKQSDVKVVKLVMNLQMLE